MRSVLVLLLLAACSSPVGPGPVISVNGAPSALHLDHLQFSSLDGVNPILHATDYLYPANPRGANARYDLVLPVGTGINGFRAYVYGDRAGDFLGADARTLSVTLWRFGMGTCPTANNDVRFYCPMAFVDLILGYDGWRDVDGWQLRTDLRTLTIESGYTYQIIVNMAGANLRLGYVELDTADPLPAPYANRGATGHREPTRPVPSRTAETGAGPVLPPLLSLSFPGDRRLPPVG